MKGRIKKSSYRGMLLVISLKSGSSYIVVSTHTLSEGGLLLRRYMKGSI